MKFSAAIIAAAGVASAKSVRNVYPRDGHLAAEQPVHPPAEVAPPLAPPEGLPHGMKGHGISPDAGNHVVVVWMNPGAGAETTTINHQITVTETVTIHAPTPPPAEHVPPPAGEHVPPPPAEHPPPPPGEHIPPTPPTPPEHTQVVPGVGATHSVTVGGEAGLVFVPDSIHAAVGDMVIFTFFNANHTATQSTFDQPCQPLVGGMDSGFIPNPEDSVDPAPQVAMQVMVADPLWFYCAQGPHCGKGMTFSINPTAERTHAMFQAMAIAQEGNGDQAPITGGAPAPPPEGGEQLPPPEGGEQLPPIETGSVPLPPLPDATGEPLPPVGGGNGVVEGIGEIQNGACVCSVQCDMGSFPNLDQQGIGSTGGFGGSIPMGQAVRRKW